MNKILSVLFLSLLSSSSLSTRRNHCNGEKQIIKINGKHTTVCVDESLAGKNIVSINVKSNTKDVRQVVKSVLSNRGSMDNYVDATKCSDTTYRGKDGLCYACPSGKRATKDGRSCEKGNAFMTNSAKCGAGTYFSVKQELCNVCSIGKSSVHGSFKCSDVKYDLPKVLKNNCAAGTYMSSLGRCDACLNNSTSIAGAKTCVTAPKEFIIKHNGCGHGTFLSEDGGNLCLPCGNNKVAPPGSSKCFDFTPALIGGDVSSKLLAVQTVLNEIKQSMPVLSAKGTSTKKTSVKGASAKGKGASTKGPSAKGVAKAKKVKLAAAPVDQQDPNAAPVDYNAAPVDPNAAPVDPNAAPVDAADPNAQMMQ